MKPEDRAGLEAGLGFAGGFMLTSTVIHIGKTSIQKKRDAKEWEDLLERQRLDAIREESARRARENAALARQPGFDQAWNEAVVRHTHEMCNGLRKSGFVAHMEGRRTREGSWVKSFVVACGIILAMLWCASLVPHTIPTPSTDASHYRPVEDRAVLMSHLRLINPHIAVSYERDSDGPRTIATLVVDLANTGDQTVRNPEYNYALVWNESSDHTQTYHGLIVPGQIVHIEQRLGDLGPTYQSTPDEWVHDMRITDVESPYGSSGVPIN